MRLIAMAAAACAAGLIGGCDGDRDDRPILKMKVRFVLVIGPNDTIGDPMNKGTRLTIEQVQQHATAMTIWMFDHLGEGVHIVPEVLPAGAVIDNCAAEFPVIGGGVCGFPPRAYRTSEFLLRVVSVDSGFVEDAVNVYFTGNILGEVNGTFVPALGGTIGEDVCDLPEPFNRRVIFVNDGAFTQQNAPGMVDPAQLTLAHEICHYLIEAAFNTSEYDEFEHTVNPNANNIMIEGLSPGQPSPKFLPQPAREEATARVAAGDLGCD